MAGGVSGQKNQPLITIQILEQRMRENVAAQIGVREPRKLNGLLRCRRKLSFRNDARPGDRFTLPAFDKCAL